MSEYGNNNNNNNNNNSNTSSFFHNCDRYMELLVCVDSNDALLYSMYQNAVEKHNMAVKNSVTPDAGFDLLCPSDVHCETGLKNEIYFNIRTCARMVCENGKTYFTGFQLCPRSSLSGTPLRLANSIGIIDSGYRGNIIGKFDCFYHNYTALQYTKLLQIVAPGMVPIYVRLVQDLGHATERGSGGFGSTGV